MKNDLITFLRWDTEHFGCRIARANVHQVDRDLLREIEDSCRQLSIDCLYFLADASDRQTHRELQRNDYENVDIRLTLQRPALDPTPDGPPANVCFRLSNESDFESLVGIVEDSYYQSRFYYDRCFSSHKASLLYQIWLTKSLTSDFADAVIVAEVERKPLGYVTCHVNQESGNGKIGLVAVSKSAQGSGLAQAMINYCVGWFCTQDIERINVVTQGRNIAAQRLYQRCGFLTSNMQMWYHKWYIDCP